MPSEYSHRMPAKKKASEKKESQGVGKPLKFPDLDELKERIDAYFAWCNPHIEKVMRPVLLKNGKYNVVETLEMTQQRPYTISGLAFFLDTTRATLLDYENLAKMDSDELPVKLRTKDPALLREYSYTIKKAKLRCEGYVEENLLTARNPVGAIFNLKNNYKKWKDQTEVVNPEEIENRKKIEELRATLTQRLRAVKKKPV